MCGIVGGVTNTNITSLLLQGLNRLEYRGYDSSGLIVLSKDNSFDRARSVGKVKNLEESIKARKYETQTDLERVMDTPRLTPTGNQYEKKKIVPPQQVKMMVAIN